MHLNDMSLSKTRLRTSFMFFPWNNTFNGIGLCAYHSRPFLYSWVGRHYLATCTECYTVVQSIPIPNLTDKLMDLYYIVHWPTLALKMKHD